MSSHPKTVLSVEDRFSQLPDDILCGILSLLSSKEAAQTRILSKRWRHVFFLVQKLIAEGIDTNFETSQKMFHVIDQWIKSSEKVSVDEFRLRSTYFPVKPVFHSWLTALLLRRIKVLELSKGFTMPPRPVRPPEELFRSETLVHLEISGNAFVLKIPDSISYPSLKTLHFANLHVEDESGHFRFAKASYPQLKEFCLNGVIFLVPISEDVKLILTISLTSLEKLVVDYDWHKRFMDKVEIDTQHLKHFQFTVEEESGCDMKVNFSKCESLVYADIYQFTSGVSYIKLLRQINNVKTIQLSDHSPQDYNDVAGSFPQFINLTHLKLRLTAHQSVWFLLQHAPNLEVLDYEMSYAYEDYFAPEDVPQCLSKCLKEIRITKWYEDDTDDDEVDSGVETFKYFLQHGAVLGRLSIGHSKMETAEWRQTTLNLLQNIARLSQKCEIELQELFW